MKMRKKLKGKDIDWTLLKLLARKIFVGASFQCG